MLLFLNAAIYAIDAYLFIRLVRSAVSGYDGLILVPVITASGYALAFLSSLVTIFDDPVQNFGPYVIFLVNFLMLFFLCKMRLLKAFLIAFSLWTVMTVTDYLSVVYLWDSSENTAVEIIAVSLAKILYMLILMVFSTVFRKSERRKKAELLSFVMPIGCGFVLETLSYFLVNSEQLSGAKALVGISVTILLAALILTEVYYERSLRRTVSDIRMASSQSRAQIEKSYYELLEKRDVQLREALHNEKFHLMTIKEMSTDAAVKAYVDKIYKNYDTTAVLGNSQNKLLDIMLGRYRSVCDGQNTAFSIKVIGADLSFLDDGDLSELVGNILDNAVCAAKCAEGSSVDFSLERRGGFELLVCKNTCKTEPVFSADAPVPKGKDKEDHGFGVKSIKRITKKYGGELTFAYDEKTKEFTLSIILPVNP